MNWATASHRGYGHRHGGVPQCALCQPSSASARPRTEDHPAEALLSIAPKAQRRPSEHDAGRRWLATGALTFPPAYFDLRDIYQGSINDREPRPSFTLCL